MVCTPSTRTPSLAPDNRLFSFGVLVVPDHGGVFALTVIIYLLYYFDVVQGSIVFVPIELFLLPSKGHIMVTVRYSSNQQKSQSRQNPCQVQSPENIENLFAPRQKLWYELQFLRSGVLAVLQNLTYKLKRRLSDVPPIHYTRHDWLKTISSYRRFTRRHVVCYTNGTDQCQNGSSNLLPRYGEQPRPTRIVAVYLRPALSATKRTIHAPNSFF